MKTNIDNKAEYKTGGHGISYNTGAGIPLNALELFSNHGSHRERQSRNNHDIRRIQRNHYDNRQRKPETGHRETKQEHRRQPKKT